MKISVVIPTLPKNKDYLKLCVESLRATVDWDIIVVSNGEEVGSNFYSDVYGITQHVHTNDQGQCNAVNIGVQQAAPDTDYIMVSNDDMFYAASWAENLRQRFLKKRVWDFGPFRCFSPNLLEPKDGPGSAQPFLTIDGGSTLEVFMPNIVNEAVDQHVHSPMKTRETTGFNLPYFIRKDIWDTIGGYDTAYDPWGSNSDTDLQTKIELAGVQPLRLRDVLVYHFGGKSGTFDGTHHDAWQRNWDYYTKKWGFNRDDEPQPDVWMAENLVNEKKNIYHPSWEGKYSENP